MMEIKERFDNARKIFGATDEIITASGVKVRGRYVLCESGVVTPSHDPLNGFRKSIGFPTDANGQTVNDRDYERDTDAQRITRQIADKYDNRALQSPVVVSQGIVLSGNGRTMAGMLAARQDTDTSYITYLMSHASKYGFQADDVSMFEHPRCVFETADIYELTAETFAMFNAQEIKSQSKTEQAVKLGKLVDTETFNRIIRNINAFETISDFYNNTRAATEAIGDLQAAGIISQMQMPEMFDGDTISQTAREILENVLIGKAFESNPDAVRQITAFKGVRKNVITALAEISNNISLGDYSLESEMAQAVNLCYQARANGRISQGEVVSGYARQMTLFSDSQTIADFTNVTVLMLSDMVNHSQVTRLKKVFAIYNHQARESASGQTDMFSGGEVKTKEEILKEVTAMFDNGQWKQISEQLASAESRRICNADNERFSSKSETKTENVKRTSNGCKVGDYVELLLPCGDSVVCKLEYIEDGTAGIRLKGFVTVKVCDELVTPTTERKCTLPDWLDRNIPKDMILETLLSFRKAA